MEQDERKKTYPTVEVFQTSRTKQADLLSTDFHLKSYKDKAEKYKPRTIQYNKHMAEYKARLEEIAELRREAEAGKTIHELKLEETMRENDEQFAEKRSQEDIEHKRDERLRNTDTETLKQLAYTANIAWTNDKLSWKERHAAKDEGRAVLDILKERGIDISQDLIAKKLPDIKEIKQELTKGETVAIPESVLKATVSTEPNDIEKLKYTYPLSPEEIKENELSGGIEIHNIGGSSKLNSKGQVIGLTDLGHIRLKNGKYYTEYQGKEGWVKGLSFDNYIHAHRYVLDKSGYKPIIDIKKEIAKGEVVDVPENVLKATVDTEPSAEVKEWFDKAHGIKDYKGGRNDRRSILSMLINAMPYGNVKSFNDMAKMAKAIGKDLGYGEPTSGTWERHFAEQIANETGRDVSIIGNAIVVHPGNKQSLMLPDGSLKPMSESKKPEARKPVEEPKPEIEAKEKIDTGDAVLDELLEQSDWMYRAGRGSKLRPEARKYIQAVYNYLLHGGEDPDIPEMLKPHSTDSTDEYIALDANLKSLFQKAVVAAKKTKSLQKSKIGAVKETVSKKKTATMPEQVLKAATGQVSDDENRHRVDLMNEKIKLSKMMNVGVFHEGKLIKGGFRDAYSARNFMNDSFFTGARANKRNLLNPYDFGWSVSLIDEKIEILNVDDLKKISEGKMVEVPEYIIKDTHLDAQIIEDLSKEEKSPHRRPYSELTQREKTIVDKEAIKQYPITSAYVGALTTISKTQETKLKEFDNLLRQGETIVIPQRLLVRQLEEPASPALLYPSSSSSGDMKSLEVGRTLEISGAKLGAMLRPVRKAIKHKPEPTSKPKHLCTPPVRVRGYHVGEHNRSCPVKKGKTKRR